MSKEEEYILCASIWFKDVELKNDEVLKIRGNSPYNVDRGIVFSGWRHPNCIYQAVAVFGERVPLLGESIQGFLTNQNRFVDRAEGGQIAFKANQTNELKNHLFSEDLY